MKKALLFSLALFIGMTAFAQAKIQLRSTDRAECTKSDMTSLKASFSFSTIEAENVTTKGGEFSWLSMPNTIIGGNEGEPQIPVINQLIAVPVGAQPTITVTSYSTTDYNLSDMGVETLIPRQPSLRKDKRPEDVPFVKNEAAYQSTRGLKAEPTASVQVVGTMRGVRLGKLGIEPISYDPVNNKIRVFNDIEVEVSFDGADQAATEQLLIDTYSPYFDIVYKQLFNDRAIRSVYDQHPDLYSTPVKMLVVTTSTYANSTAFQNWLTWKKQKGINVDVQTVANNASASTIKNLIYTRYNANHPSFLVIVGDETVVTYYQLWDYDSSYGDAATDLEYASVDGDIYHDMFISRMPVSSTTELGNLVNKILTYEKYTMSDPSYLDETLLIAGWDSNATAVIGTPTIQYASNYYFNSAHGINAHVFCTTASGQTTCYNYINNVGFVNYTAHGDIQKWHDPQFTNSNVNSLTNNDKYFWAMGNCCLTANFKNSSNSQTCFGETMVRAANKGAFGYIGSVPESLWYEDYYFALGATNTFGQMPTQSQTATGAYDALFDDTGFNTLNSVPYIGDIAVSYASSGNYNISGENGNTYEEYYWRAYQCFGDGSVMPYLNNPVANNVSFASTIPAGASSFTVNADARSYVSITVNNEIIGVAAVPANATSVDVPFTTTPQAGQTAMIVVTRNQRQPYIYNNVPIDGELVYPGITYNPTQEHGTINVDPAEPYVGQMVHLTATPELGYKLDHWEVNTVSKGNVEVLQDGEGNDYFIMPEQAVTIEAVFAQKLDPETLTIYGDNTTTNEYVPIYGYWADRKSKCEFIIPKEKISEMNGGSISAMKFYLNNSGDNNEFTVTFDVFVKEVEATTLSGWLGQSNATTVFTGNITIPKSGSNVEFDIPFSSNYVYNGGNLLVGFYQTGSTTSYNHTYWTGESQTTNTAYGGYSSSGSAQKFLPKTTFTYEFITTPTISLPATATVLTGFTETLTATTMNVTGTPTITYTSSNTSVATVSGNGTTATVTAVSAGTATITATMSYEGTDYTAQCAITVEDPSYCEPSFSNPSDDYIQNFVTTGGTTNISNSSTYETGGYSDYYNTQSASIYPGETLSCTVTPSSTSYKYGHAIWVDWNKDYEFSSTEKVAYSTSSATGNWEGSFTIPANTAAGDYRMRVIHQYTSQNTNPATDPCVSTTYGEAEDYKLTVLSTGAYTVTCATTTGGTISADKNNADENDVITITATPEADYLLTALTYTPVGGTAQNIDITNTPYTFTMPAANVTVNATFSLPACPRPTNLTVSNLAASHATVSWDSEAGNYTVKYSTATVDGTTLDPIFEDGFENGIGNWTIYAMGYDGSAYNWQQYDGTLVDEGNHNGDYVAASRSWTNSDGDQSVDNWLVTPQMTLGDVVKFWVACNDGYRDSYAVYVSTGSNEVISSTSIGDFVLVKSYAEATGTWTEIPIDISAYAGQQGYVAIRHTNYGGDHIMVDDFGVYNTINTYSYGGWTTVSPNPTTESCQLTGLSAETLYEVQVQANCGGTDGSSAWSTIHFTTPDNCGAPQELASSNVTATTATLSWADDKDSYNLQYRKVYFYENFEGSDGIPTGWTTINNSSTAGSLNWQVLHLTNHSGNNSVGSGSYIYQNTGITPDNWLISPQLDLQGTLRVWLSGYGDRNEEHFEILLSTSGTSVSDFTTTLVGETTTSNSYVEYTADLSSYSGKGYIAIHHFNCSDQNYLCVDDFGIYGSENWMTLSPNPTTEAANLTGLTPNTQFEWQVQGVNCDGFGGTSEWSVVATFNTMPGMTKEIVGYGEGTGGWYLIASPVEDTITPTADNGFITDKFDLYRFKQSAYLEEWQNWKVEEFNLENGTGYLYADSVGTTLTFTGTPITETSKTVYLDFEDNHELSGWNLVGNPFGVNAYIDRPFYIMNEEGNNIIAASDVDRGYIEPMEGIFVIAQQNGEPLTFTTVASTKGSVVTLDLSDGGGVVVDRTMVRFDKSRQLPKLMLNEANTKMYIPKGGSDYAVVRSNGSDKLHVNFEPAEDGTYVISTKVKNVGLRSLYLVDRLRGVKVDLLCEPEYKFEAKVGDKPDRFDLVYEAGFYPIFQEKPRRTAHGEEFGFVSDGNLIISNEGKSVLQVIDVTGRILSSEPINGSHSMHIDAAPGVYLLRLVNGDNIKTQKIVIK